MTRTKGTQRAARLMARIAGALLVAGGRRPARPPRAPDHGGVGADGVCASWFQGEALA